MCVSVCDREREKIEPFRKIRYLRQVYLALFRAGNKTQLTVRGLLSVVATLSSNRIA